jgi:hypothetical protein
VFAYVTNCVDSENPHHQGRPTIKISFVTRQEQQGRDNEEQKPKKEFSASEPSIDIFHDYFL